MASAGFSAGTIYSGLRPSGAARFIASSVAAACWGDCGNPNAATIAASVSESGWWITPSASVCCVSIPSSGQLRVAWLTPSGTVEYSRTVAIS